MLHWLTTDVNPRRSYFRDPTGWRLHAVEAPESATLTAVARQPALCGLVPAHGWNLDMFIDRRCARCEKAAGLAPSPENVLAAEVRRELRLAAGRK